jgi:hypothetical protein
VIMFSIMKMATNYSRQLLNEDINVKVTALRMSFDLFWTHSHFMHKFQYKIGELTTNRRASLITV